MIPNIYNSDFVAQLFDEMSESYERMNTITSFGFSNRWRRQFVEQIAIQPGMTVCDLMCGMGECWDVIAEKIGKHGQIIGIDLSQGMLNGASRKCQQLSAVRVDLAHMNILDSALQPESVDVVLSGFGLKTFSPDQLYELAREIKRILKPGGRFSLVEVSVPRGWWLCWLYLFYLKAIIPILGWLFLGNPENYRMLGIYTEQFGDCRTVCELFAESGLSVSYHRYFWGCASGISGEK